MLIWRAGEAVVAAFLVTMLMWPQGVLADAGITDKAKRFIAQHDAQIRPLEIAVGIAWWNANISGDDKDFAAKEAAQNRLDQALANRDTFKNLKAIHEARQQINDPIIARAIEVLYLQYLEKQVDPELLQKITSLANNVEKTFNNFRAKVDGAEMTDSEVRKVLKESSNSERRRAVWEASKQVGAEVEADLKQLVKLRNEAAKKLGFPNFHALYLYLNEQDGPTLIALFDELDQLTREPFLKAKAEFDARLASNCGIKVDELRPWHYHDPFFQDSPAVFDANLDAPYQGADVMDICRRFYRGINLPIDDVLARSDLYEKKGKSPHAFCTDIDREGDVRVLANVVPNEYWMGTMLHELGHAVYSSKNIPRTLPYPLRGEAHILATEGVAMQMQKFSKSRPFLEKMGLKVENPGKFDETAAKVLRNELLIFSRWCQVMLRFEKAMYENPDQDLNQLWWGLVEKYQGIKCPTGRNAPDYGSKIHIVSAPVYYHNYMMGQLFASQVHHALCKELYPGTPVNQVLYNDNPKVGEFMTQRVFAPGRTLPWNALTKHATGSELNAKAFAADFQVK
jgi:peptidyl-dipeptidase A